MELRNKIRAVAVAVFATAGFAASAAPIDLGFALDESGSISSSDYALVRDGLASALAQVPVGGANTYRIGIVNFNNNARTIVPVTSIDTQADLDGVINTLTTTPKVGGLTDIAAGIDLLTQNFVDFGLGASSIFNVATDGQGGDTGAAAGRASMAGIDSLSFEAIGSGANVTDLLAAAFPGSPVLVNDPSQLPGDILTGSFVYEVATFADFDAAIQAKVGKVIIDTGGNPNNPNVVPLPAGLPLLASGLLGMLGFRRFRRKAA